jgi:hypothetical protein
VVTVAGQSTVINGNDNAIVNFGGNVTSGTTANTIQGTAPGGTFVSVCGNEVFGQATHINTETGGAC